MFIVHYKLGKDYTIKMFNDHRQAFDFKDVLDEPIKIIKFDPSSPEPQVVWYGPKSTAKTKELAIKPFDKKVANEYNLCVEDIIAQVRAFSLGLIEQVKRFKQNQL